MIRKEMTGFEHAILSAADEVAHKGDMRKLLNDVGIRKKELNFAASARSSRTRTSSCSTR